MQEPRAIEERKSAYRSLNIDTGTHRRIRALAEDASRRQGRRVTYVEVIRTAIAALERGGAR